MAADGVGALGVLVALVIAFKALVDVCSRKLLAQVSSGYSPNIPLLGKRTSFLVVCAHALRIVCILINTVIN